ncbi:MAG: hypothetical protein L3J59_10925 [Methylococcaceae bacterium]|nr:hypothetical protein [Methylococcaceae bacterium]
MKPMNVMTGVLLFFTVGVSQAEMELSSLVQWEESQNGQIAMRSVSDNDIINDINSMDATAAGHEQFSSLVQWEESQYAQPYLLASQSDESIVANINAMGATAAGQSEMSSLIQWEESF